MELLHRLRGDPRKMRWKQLAKKLWQKTLVILSDPEKLRKLITAIIVVPVVIYIAYVLIRAILGTFFGWW